VTLVGAFSLGAAGQVMSGKLLRHSVGGAYRSGAGATLLSGCLAGPPNTNGELTLLSNTQLTVQAFRALIANALDATAGGYIVPNDGVVTLGAADGFPVQDASQFRRAIVAVYVADAQIVGSGANQPYLQIIGGPLAATIGAAALPALPANTSGLLLGELAIPPVGQAVSLTPYNPRTTTRGGILPLLTEAACNAVVTAGTPLARGAAFYAEDTGATGYYDAVANRIIWYDSRWQTFIPILANGNAAPGVAWGAVGNAAIQARYYRTGRHITYRGFVQVGSSTSYGGAGSGAIMIGYPPGYFPYMTQTAFSESQGTAIINNGSGYSVLFAGVAPSATPGNRRLNLWTANNPTVTVNGVTGAYGISAVNHMFAWNVQYETAFEA
jgi:hypothetical protein